MEKRSPTEQGILRKQKIKTIRQTRKIQIRLVSFQSPPLIFVSFAKILFTRNLFCCSIVQY